MPTTVLNVQAISIKDSVADYLHTLLCLACMRGVCQYTSIMLFSMAGLCWLACQGCAGKYSRAVLVGMPGLGCPVCQSGLCWLVSMGCVVQHARVVLVGMIVLIRMLGLCRLVCHGGYLTSTSVASATLIDATPCELAPCSTEMPPSAIKIPITYFVGAVT